MNKHTLLGIIAGILLLCNVALLVHCWKTEGKRDPNEGPRLAIIEKLRLSQSQILAYDQFIQQHRSAMNAEDLKIRLLKGSLYTSLLDSNKQDSIINLISLEQKKIEHINLAHFNEIRALCDTQQKVLFQNMTNELGELFSPRRHKP